MSFQARCTNPAAPGRLCARERSERPRDLESAWGVPLGRRQEGEPFEDEGYRSAVADLLDQCQAFTKQGRRAFEITIVSFERRKRSQDIGRVLAVANLAP